LDHPSIVAVYDAGDVDGVLFIAMRYVRGTDLAALITGRGVLPAAETLAILDQVAAALDAAHAAGLVHRDVKPANVMIEGERLPRRLRPHEAHDLELDPAHQVGHLPRDGGLRGARADRGSRGGRPRRHLRAHLRAVRV